jgi:large subunit ribosomal protein L25
MKTMELKGSARETLGTKDAKKLRQAGRVPGVLYTGAENIHFYIDEIPLGKAIYTPETYRIKLDISGKGYDTVIKDIQFHPITDKITHIDFIQLYEDKAAEITLPVIVTGSAEGVKAGGRLVIGRRNLKVRALPKHLPESIILNVDALKIGDSIKVEDIQISGLALVEAPNVVVVAVKTARAVVEETPVAAAATAAATPTAGAEAKKEEPKKAEGKK